MRLLKPSTRLCAPRTDRPPHPFLLGFWVSGSMWKEIWNYHLFMGKTGNIYKLKHLNTVLVDWKACVMSLWVYIESRTLTEWKSCETSLGKKQGHFRSLQHGTTKPQSKFPQWLCHRWLRVRSSSSAPFMLKYHENMTNQPQQHIE